MERKLQRGAIPVLATRGVLRTASNGIHEKFGKLLLSQGLLLHFRSRHSIFRLYQLLSARVRVQISHRHSLRIWSLQKSSTNSLKISLLGYQESCARGGRNFRRNISRHR